MDHTFGADCTNVLVGGWQNIRRGNITGILGGSETRTTRGQSVLDHGRSRDEPYLVSQRASPSDAGSPSAQSRYDGQADEQELENGVALSAGVRDCATVRPCAPRSRWTAVGQLLRGWDEGAKTWIWRGGRVVEQQK